MSYDIWQEHGGLTLDTPEVRKAAAAVKALYDEEWLPLDNAHSVGGRLHVVVEDYNLEDSFLDYCQESETFDEFEQAAYDALRPLSVEERASALALKDGYWSPR